MNCLLLKVENKWIKIDDSQAFDYKIKLAHGIRKYRFLKNSRWKLHSIPTVQLKEISLQKKEDGKLEKPRVKDTHLPKLRQVSFVHWNKLFGDPLFTR